MPQDLIHKVSLCLDVNRHGLLVIHHDIALSLSAFPHPVSPLSPPFLLDRLMSTAQGPRPKTH